VVTITVAAGSPGNLDAVSTVSVPVNSAGVADFGNLVLDVAGVYTLTASYNGSAGSNNSVSFIGSVNSNGSVSVNSAAFTAAAAGVDLSLNSSQVTSGVPTISVGDPFDLGGAFIDHAAVPLQAVISWGDGVVTSVPVTVVNQQGQFATDHVYSQEGSFLVGVTIEDAQGDIVGLGALSGPVQVVPAHFGPVDVVFGQPGQTVTQSVTDPNTGVTIIVSLTLGAGDPGGGYLLVTQLNNPLAAPTASIAAFIASFDVRQFNLPADAAAAISFIIPGDLPIGTVGQLLFLDRDSNPAGPTERGFIGPTIFIGPSVLFGVNQFTTPRITDLTGTVFTVAAAIPTQTVSAVVSASVASTAPISNIPIQTATFQTTSTLTLTLEPTQASQVSSGLSMLSTNAVGGGGGDDESGAASALLQFLWNELEDILPKLFFRGGAADAGPTSAPPSTAAPAPAVPKGTAAPAEQQGSLSALDLFWCELTPRFDWFTLSMPVDSGENVGLNSRIDLRNPAAPTNETVAFAAAAAVGLGQRLLGRTKRRTRSHPPSILPD
jgi:hypothetical protein